MNGEMNLFNPLDLELSRSTFRYTPTRSGSCLAGRLYPVFEFEVMPGDSIKMDLNALFKMSTPVYPTMDTLYADVYFFFVPNRLVLGRRYGNPDVNDSNTSWKAIVGSQDNNVNMPLPATGLKLVAFEVGTRAYQDYDIWNYFGVHGVRAASPYHRLNPLPLLSYCAIWSENFRDPNLMAPITWSFNGANVWLQGYVPVNVPNTELGLPSPAYSTVNALIPGQNTAGTVTSAGNVLPFCTCRFHGYLGSALPWPQRNSTGVELPLGDLAPVVTGSNMVNSDGTSDFLRTDSLRFASPTGTTFSSLPSNSRILGGADGSFKVGATSTTTDVATVGSIVPSNLYADLSSATAANVNALRLAIQQQRWYEKLARSGNRYDELVYGLFGVRQKDSGADRPVYLGGKRIPLNIEMVASTQGGVNPGLQGAGSLGALGAFSHTNDSDHYFYHSFDDFGILECVFTIRHHTTVDGFLKNMWHRLDRESMYFPTFAHLGEQSIPLSTVTGNPADDGSTFGYQEAWQDYRQEPDIVCGLLRTSKNFGFMTYAESFNSLTTLAQFLNASYQVQSIDKTLAVPSTASGFQFIYQFNFDMTARRCMPTHSIPGLMDHF